MKSSSFEINVWIEARAFTCSLVGSKERNWVNALVFSKVLVLFSF
ncbi:hypothetical protein [Lacihabitans lacunae]|uniref:Uncharacterized protein n=1 Tax=Lacihabitans lacunae TaxID=1028214 RepID=A0ABV7YR04_9BACT